MTRLAICLILLAGAGTTLAQSTRPTLPSVGSFIPDKEMLSSQAAVRVDRLKFEGNTVFDNAALLATPIQFADDSPGTSRTIGDLLGGELTLEQLEQIRVALTLKYVDAGYINSGAVIPDQPVTAEQTILIRIVEGTLNRIDITGRKRLRESYIADRIRRAASGPLNVLKLRDELEILRQDPRLRRINAELRPGEQPGEGLLDVDIEEARPYQFAVQFSNRRPPSVGAERFEAYASHLNVSGFGDSINLRYGINRGDLSDWEWAGLEDFDLDYTIPLSASGTTLALTVSRSDSTLVEQPFDLLDLDTQSTRFSILVRQPIRRTPTSELAAFVGLTAQYTTTEILGERQSISPGARGGESNVTAIRFGAEYYTQSTKAAFSIRSTFAVGLGALDSTVNAGDIPDSQFISWLGQAQYVHRIGETEAQLILRASTQLTPDSLLSPEQFAIGGVDTVRGYRENQIVRDNGIVGTIEFRLPVWTRRATREPILQLVPFFDAGYGFNRTQEPVGEFLGSVGAGLIFTPSDRVTAEVFYGRRLNDVSDDSGNLQDYGWHFNIVIRAF